MSKKRKGTGNRVDNPPSPFNPNSLIASQLPRRSKRLMGKSSKPPGISKTTSPEKPKESKGASSSISLSPQMSLRIVQSHKSPMSRIKIRSPDDAKSSNSPFTSSPYTAQRSVSTPSPGLVKFRIGLSPFSEISSMIMNVPPPQWMAVYYQELWFFIGLSLACII